MKVRDLMSRELVFIDVDRNIYDAIRLMRKKKVSRLLVKDEGRVVGILTERDVLRRLGYWKERKLLSTHIHVSSVYTKGLKMIDEEKDVKEALRMMLRFGISSLVVEKDGEVTGIVTRTDLLKLLKGKDVPITNVMRKPLTIPLGSTLLHARRMMMERGIKKLLVMDGNELVGVITEGDIARALTSFRRSVEGRHPEKKMKEIRVDDVMSKDPITVNEDTTVGHASRLMVENGIGCLPVKRGGEVVGMVTKSDLLKVLLE